MRRASALGPAPHPYEPGVIVMANETPQLTLRAYDMAGKELNNVQTKISGVPENLGFDDAALIALLDAARRYHVRYPTLASIEIELVRDKVS